jgi:hypothetical protein
MSTQFYTKSGVDSLLTNYYTRGILDERQGSLSAAVQNKLDVFDFNATMHSHYYTRITSNNIFQGKLSLVSPVAGGTSLISNNVDVKNLYVSEPVQMLFTDRNITIGIDPDAYYRQATVTSLISDAFIGFNARVNTLEGSISSVQPNLPYRL